MYCSGKEETVPQGGEVQNPLSEDKSDVEEQISCWQQWQQHQGQGDSQDLN